MSETGTNRRDVTTTPRGPLGDAIPDASAPGGKDHDARASGSQPQEKVEDRPNVSTVTPESYPIEERQDGNAALPPERKQR